MFALLIFSSPQTRQVGAAKNDFTSRKISVIIVFEKILIKGDVMKKTLIFAVICAAALTACNKNKTDIDHETVTTTEAATTATIEPGTTATSSTTVTTTATTTVTTTETVNTADEDGEPTVIRIEKLPEDIFEEYEFNTFRYYNGRTYDDLTEEEKENPASFPLYSTLDGELTDEHKQMLYDYFTSHEFEEVDHTYTYYLWDCGLPHDKSAAKNLIWLIMAYNKEWLERPHMNGNYEFIFSADRKYFALREGLSGSFNTYKIDDPEELDFLYDLVPQ